MTLSTIKPAVGHRSIKTRILDATRKHCFQLVLRR